MIYTNNAISPNSTYSIVDYNPAEEDRFEDNTNEYIFTNERELNALTADELKQLGFTPK